MCFIICIMSAYVGFKRLEKEREIEELEVGCGSRIDSLYFFVTFTLNFGAFQFKEFTNLTVG